MKLNNKGTSLVELIVSIALLSVVMLFMFNLLLDLNNEYTNPPFAKDNQVNRTEILREIHNDLNDNIITKVEPIAKNVNDRLYKEVKFVLKDNLYSILRVEEKSITYKSSTNETKKWTLKNCNANFEDVFVSSIGNNDTNIYSMIIRIEIYNNNGKNSSHKNNNPIDDIVISYFGNLNDLEDDFKNEIIANNLKL